MKNLMILLIGVMLLSSCVTTTESVTTNGGSYRAEAYSELYATSNKKSVLIMPPINRTVNVEAKEYVYSSLAQPLCNKGYYVFSPYLALETLKDESAYDAELYIDKDLSKLNDLYGADLALFTVIHSWDKSALTNSVTIQIEYVMKSTLTNKEVFHRMGTVVVDTKIEANKGENGLAGILVDMTASAINTMSTKKIMAVRTCNSYIFQDLPCGDYSDQYGKDQNISTGGTDVNIYMQRQ